MIRTPRHLLRDSRRLRLSATLGVDAAARTSLHAHAAARLGVAAARLDAALPSGCVALVTGASGAGKSTLLASLVRRCGPRAIIVRPLSRDADRLCVAALCKRLPLDRWAALLARFGLADAGVLLGRVRDLSAGERARLDLAHAAARAERLISASDLQEGATGSAAPGGVCAERAAAHVEIARDECANAPEPQTPLQSRRSLWHPPPPARPITLIADEWCSLLDEHTARAVACGAARWASEHNVRLVCATARAGAVQHDVDLLITLDGQGKGGARWTACTSIAAA